METVTIRGQEIFQSGGPFNGDYYTDADLDAMVEAFDQVGFKPPIKLGHAEKQEQLKAEEYRKIFGAPSLGQIGRLYRRGQKLFADFINVPKHLAELISKKAYSRISAEIFWRFACDATGRTFDRVLKAVSLLGADCPAITSLKDIEALYQRTATSAVRAYERGHEFRVYESNLNQEDSMWNRNEEPKVTLGGLTATSKEFARVAFEYARENDLDFASAAKELMHARTKRHEQESPVSPAKELAQVAKQVQGVLKINFIDALLSVARGHPSIVKRIADDWLLEQARRNARGKPGFVSGNEAAGLIEALKANPAVAQARNSGVLTENALRLFFPQWF